MTSIRGAPALAEISPSAVLGQNVAVWQFATICDGTEIGDDSVVGSCVWIGKGCKIGKNVHIQHGAFIPNESVIEDHVFIGPNAVMTDDKYPRSGNKDYIRQPPLVCMGASIGAGAVILPGIIVGPGAMVAAGAVVTSNIAHGDIAIGVPARSVYHKLPEVL